MNSFPNEWIALASSGWKSGTLWDIAAPEVRNPQEGEDWTDSQPTAGPSILLRGIMMKLIKFLLTAQSSPRCSLPEAGAPSNTLCTALIKCATLKIGMSYYENVRLPKIWSPNNQLLWTFFAISLWASLSLAVAAGIVPTARTSWDTEGRRRSNSYCRYMFWIWPTHIKLHNEQKNVSIHTWTEASSLVASKDPTLRSMLMNW